MVTTVDKRDPAMLASSDATRQRTLSGWVLRVVVSVHLVAIFGQPVFAGIFLSGDYDGLRWHEIGANVATSVGYVQLITASLVWVRLRHSWPFFLTFAIVAAETVQYFAGMDGALWLHLPLGVIIIVAIAVMFIAVSLRPLRPQQRAQRQRTRSQRTRTTTELERE